MSQSWEAAFCDESSHHSPVRLLSETPTHSGQSALILAPPGALPYEGQGRYVRVQQKRDSGASQTWTMTDGRTAPAFDTSADRSVPTNFSERSQGLALQRNGAATRLPDFSLSTDFSLMVSSRLLDILLTFDADAILHAPVEFRFKDGSRPDAGAERHIVFVRRLIYAADVDRTLVWLVRNMSLGRSAPWEPGDMGPIAFRQDIPDDCHIFKQRLYARNPARPNALGPRSIDGDRFGFFASRELMSAIAKAKLTNIDFLDPAMIHQAQGVEAARRNHRGPYPSDPLFHYRKT